VGRIKTKLVKRITKDLLNRDKTVFKEDFEHNKKAVGARISETSKKMRNIIAGYVTREMKRKEEI